MPNKSKTYVSNILILIILQYLVTIFNFTTEIYFPSLPAITHGFNLSEKFVALTVSLYFLGVIIGQVIFGVFSDYFGRKKMILTGLCINMLGLFICFYSRHGCELLFGRVIQGMGIASCMCIPRAIIRDLFSGKNMSRIYSYLTITMEIAITLAPICGSYFQYHFGWHSIFLVMFVLGLISLFLVILFLPETKLEESIKTSSPTTILGGITNIFKNKIFIGSSLCSSLSASSIYAYLTITPFFYQNILKISLVNFGFLTSIVSIVLIIGSIINIQLVKKHSLLNILMIGIIMMVMGSASMVILSLLHYPEISLTIVLLPFLLLTLGTSFVFPNCIAEGTKTLRSQFGLASSIYSTIQYMGVFIIIILESALERSLISFAILLTVISLATLFIFYRFIFTEFASRAGKWQPFFGALHEVSNRADSNQ